MSQVTYILQQRLQAALAQVLGPDYAHLDPQVRPAVRPQFGDYQANIAMSLARDLGRNPRDLAQAIAQALSWQDICAQPPEVAGPGFINFRLSDTFLARQAQLMLTDPRLGVTSPPQPQTVVVDYSGPNIAKEMHVGHLRSTIIGDCLVRVLEFLGHRVIRQNHIGDWGTQFGHVVLALWYEAAALFESHGQDTRRLDDWIARWNQLRKLTPQNPEEKQKKLSDQRDIIHRLIPWHQRMLDQDPDGDRFFRPYLETRFPSLARLQELYAFVVDITDHPAAQDYRIWHQRHGWTRFDQLPSLVATFVQNPDKPQNEVEKLAWQKARDLTIRECQKIYDRLDVLLTPHDVRGESHYNPDLPQVVQELRSKNLAVRSEGAWCVFPPGFVNTEGKPLPLIIQKSDGGYLYATTDLAALRYRVQHLKADRIIYVTDARQKQHFAMVFRVAQMAGWAPPDKVLLEHVPFGTVLGEDGKPFKTRTGDTVRLAELLDEAEERAFQIVTQKNPDLPEDHRRRIAHAIGIGAVKYADLSNDRVKDYLFSWDRMLAFDGNTAPYLQNAYVRIRSIFRKAQAQGLLTSDPTPDQLARWSITLTHPTERQLLLQFLQFPLTVQQVARSLEPHHLCSYLFELATLFHQFYETCPVLSAPEPSLRDSRLALCWLTARILEKGLQLLGIHAPDQM